MTHASDLPAWAALVGTDGYVKAQPSCPSGGTYTINAVSTNPTCSVAGTHVLP